MKQQATIESEETPRPRDVHSRLQDLVDEHFGVRPTTPIEGLLAILESELGHTLGPPVQSVCSGCGEDVDAPHTWQECHGVLKARLDLAEKAPDSG